MTLLPHYLNYCEICDWSGVAGSCPNCNGDRGLRLFVRAEQPAPDDAPSGTPRRLYENYGSDDPWSPTPHGSMAEDTYIESNGETLRVVGVVAAGWQNQDYEESIPWSAIDRLRGGES